MKNIYKFFVIMFFLIIGFNQSYSVVPTYQLIAKNFTLEDTLGNTQNMLKFNIYLQWTNQGTSDPFNYASCQYCITVNTSVIAGQTWTISKLASDLPSSLQPGVSTNTPTAQIRFTGNLPGVIYEVSPSFPGTLVMRSRIVTNATSFPETVFGFKWKNSGSGLINKISYLAPNGLGVFITDTTNHILADTLLPVELTSFSSNVNKNNVSLNWSTANEINNQSFDIERKSINTEIWSKIGNVAGNGTTHEPRSYSFSERINSGKYNYRLKQIDYNGNFEYFNLSNEVEVGIPNEFSISQNYPNPFNPSTKIDYDIPFDSKVNIILYDISGREVGTLLNDVKTAGYYTLQFNASNFASGMYFYRISVQGNNNNFVRTKKMMLVK